MKIAKLKIENYKIILTGIFVCLFLLVGQNASAGTIIKSPAYLGLQNGLVGCCLPAAALAQAGNFDGSYTKAPDCSGNGNTGEVLLPHIACIILMP